MTFHSAVLELGECEAVADRSGALYLPSARTLVVADLHLEKGSAFAVRGVMLPPYDTRDTLQRLGEVLERYRPACVIALGDSIHDGAGADRLGTAELRELRAIQTGREWIWVTGNHDPEIRPVLGGTTARAVTIGALVLRHDPGEGVGAIEVSGHLHPAARALLGGVGVRHRCFAGDGRRLVLPAFGAFTGGLNVLDEAFGAVLDARRLAVHLVGRDGVYPVAREWLVPD